VTLPWCNLMMGGGWPLPDPSGILKLVASVAVAAGNTVLFTNGPNEIARVMHVAARVTAGVAPTAIVNIVGNGSTTNVVLTPNLLLTAERQAFVFSGPILLAPLHFLQGRHFGGDAATIVEFVWYAYVAPLGTNFGF